MTGIDPAACGSLAGVDGDGRGRDIGITRVPNLRDVGGYPAADGRQTRWGTLLRSGDLKRLADADRTVLAALPVRTVLDLREPGEAASAPDRLDGIGGPDRCAERVPIPIFQGDLPADPGLTIAALYRYTVDHHADTLAAAVGVLAEPGALPAIVHCSAGKDRTGIVVALVLTVAGVERDVVVDDYAQSAAYLGPRFAERIKRQLAGWTGDAAAAAVALSLATESPPQAMRDTLDHIDAAYGGVTEYLAAAGVGPARQRALRDGLTSVDGRGQNDVR